jgi:hypothetical protein
MLTDDERGMYTARQYQSLREEIAQAREAQHSILQWNQAVSGTLFAAALVAATSHAAHYVVAAQFVFGLVLPTVLLGGALAWAGEMIRMERAGVFLRSFERGSWGSEEEDSLARTSFFIWENFLWSPPAKFIAAGYRKQNVGYLGVAIFYAIMYSGSLIAFCTFSAWWLSLIACSTLLVLASAVMVPPAIQIFKLGGSSPVVTADELAVWLKELGEDKGLLGQSGTLVHIKTFFTRPKLHSRPDTLHHGGMQESESSNDTAP